MRTALRMKKVPRDSLFVSEPNPMYFGNPGNDARASWTNLNWLKSRFHFAFAEFQGPPLNFGVLRVLNDDLVQPQRGFGTHPHSDMEIATFIVEGELTHQDSLGSKESLGRGSVQFMSAGKGIRHSERNEGLTPLRFLQLWIMPDARNLKPNYGGFDGSTPEAVAARANKLHHVVSSSRTSAPTPIKLSQDVNIFQAEVTDHTLEFALGQNRQAYFVCAEGGATLRSKDDAVELEQGDACELRGPMEPLTITSHGKAYYVVVEMSKD